MSWFFSKSLATATFNLRAHTVLEKMRMFSMDIPKAVLEKDEKIGAMLSEIHTYLEGRATGLSAEEKKKYIDQFAKALLNKDVQAFIQGMHDHYTKFNLDAESSFWPACDVLTSYLKTKSCLYAERSG